ncbi:hypothetical protein GALMADRAFT_209666 [Galerina marginata CBS 339.88]|uniref:Uncharacterized protein n=1 Tax=Galerina marginata (strain CBS 339.88) TaxID=685588 RepID=A0A067TEC7_GALM3|nr:hypothetical protein GALMADRAFT_209666 [Galerina marginata CBS 339.88]
MSYSNQRKMQRSRNHGRWPMPSIGLQPFLEVWASIMGFCQDDDAESASHGNFTAAGGAWRLVRPVGHRGLAFASAQSRVQTAFHLAITGTNDVVKKPKEKARGRPAPAQHTRLGFFQRTGRNTYGHRHRHTTWADSGERSMIRSLTAQLVNGGRRKKMSDKYGPCSHHLAAFRAQVERLAREQIFPWLDGQISQTVGPTQSCTGNRSSYKLSADAGMGKGPGHVKGTGQMIIRDSILYTLLPLAQVRNYDAFHGQARRTWGMISDWSRTGVSYWSPKILKLALNAVREEGWKVCFLNSFTDTRPERNNRYQNLESVI